MANAETHINPDHVLPDHKAESVLDIDFAQLALEGKTDVFIDLDLTLRRRRHEDCDVATAEFLHAQRSAGNITSLTVATNSRSDVSSCARQVEANLVQPFHFNGELIRKPDARFFEAALRQAGVQADSSVMIGDRYQLDVVGAKRAGMHSILVEPIGRDYPLDILRRTRSKDRSALYLARVALEGEGDLLADTFKERLEAAKPILFELARQLVDSEDSHKWDLLIGDDTSGRLLTRFVRKILDLNGNSVPTRYICASRTLQGTLDSSAFEEYIRGLSTMEHAPRHPLVISERSSTGETLTFLEAHLAKYFDTVDFAIGAVRYPGKLTVNSPLIIGGRGAKASRAISAAFERLGDRGFERLSAALSDLVLPCTVRSWMRETQKTLKTKNEISASGLRAPIDLRPDSVPLAVLDPRREARTVAGKSYPLIDQLAQEFYYGQQK